MTAIMLQKETESSRALVTDVKLKTTMTLWTKQKIEDLPPPQAETFNCMKVSFTKHHDHLMIPHNGRSEPLPEMN
jgi:hypothetical protein